MLYAIHSGSVRSYADMGYSSFFDDLGDLAHVDWAIVQEKYWHDTVDQQTAAMVGRVIRADAHVPPVQVHRDWYY